MHGCFRVCHFVGHMFCRWCNWGFVSTRSLVSGAQQTGLDSAELGGFSTLWTPVFFGLRRLRGALLVMLPLWVSVLGATLAMFELDRAAGLAFLPYILWVTIAAALNYRVAQLNPTVAPRDLSAD